MANRYESRGVDLNRYSTHRKKKRKRAGLIATNIVCSIVLVLSILTTSGMMMLNMRFRDQSVGEGEGTGTEIVDGIGSIHEDVTYFLILGTDEKDTLTDVVMVGCFDHGNHALNILQIPRDTFIGSDIPSGKLNAVYGNAPAGQSKIDFLINRINEYFGLPIDHYVLVHLSAFRNVVNAVGGVDVDLPHRLYVNDSGSREHYYIGPGLTHLNGEQAEGFVRNRSGKGYASGDMARVEAQRVFYAAFAKKVMNMSMGSMVNIVTSCYDQFKTDMSVGQLLGYAQALRQVSMESIYIAAVPGQGGYYVAPGMRQELSYYSIHKDDYVNLINQYFMPYGDPLSEEDVGAIELHTTKYQSGIKDGENFGALSGSEEADSESQ